MTIFGSIETGRSALRAQMMGMAVSGQNVANANTPGYSRQRVELAPAVPALTTGLSLVPGYGVEITAITRVRSEFYHTPAVGPGSHLFCWGGPRAPSRGGGCFFWAPGGGGGRVFFFFFFLRGGAPGPAGAPGGGGGPRGAGAPFLRGGGGTPLKGGRFEGVGKKRGGPGGEKGPPPRPGGPRR